MYCKNCGAMNSDTVEFCYKCGVSLRGKSSAWRDGDTIFVTRNGTLPRNCVKCGQLAAGEPLNKSFYWHSPWLYLILLISPIIYVIVALIVRKRFDLLVPLCEEHRRRRRTMLGIGIPLLFAIVLLPFLGAAVAGDDGIGFGLLLGFLALIAGIVVLVGARSLHVTRIEGGHALFRGASEDFLRLLPAGATSLYR